MNCKTEYTYAHIVNYLAGDMDAAEQTRFETHLLECDECFAQVQLLEKATLLIRSEGEDAFIPHVAPRSLIERLKVFWERLSAVQNPQWRFAPVAVVLLLGASFVFSYVRYHADVQQTFDLPSVEHLESGFRTSSEIETESMQQFRFMFSNGLSSFVNGKYHESLSVFESLQSQLGNLDLPEQQKNEWYYTLHLYLGLGNVQLWRQHQPGYAEWLAVKVGIRYIDRTLLHKAKHHLSEALQVATLTQDSAKPQLETIISEINEQLAVPE